MLYYFIEKYKRNNDLCVTNVALEFFSDNWTRRRMWRGVTIAFNVFQTFNCYLFQSCKRNWQVRNREEVIIQLVGATFVYIIRGPAPMARQQSANGQSMVSPGGMTGMRIYITNWLRQCTSHVPCR